MLDEFYRDILEFYMDPANVQALEEYRKAKEEARGRRIKHEWPSYYGDAVETVADP